MVVIMEQCQASRPIRGHAPGAGVLDDQAPLPCVLQKGCPDRRLAQGGGCAEHPEGALGTGDADVHAAHVGDKADADRGGTCAHAAQDDDVQLPALVGVHGAHCDLRHDRVRLQPMTMPLGCQLAAAPSGAMRATECLTW